MTDLIDKLKDLERVTGRMCNITIFGNGTLELEIHESEFDAGDQAYYDCKDAQDCREQMYRIILEHRQLNKTK